ncbi:MarR family transcriptional regulator [Polynucleobacter sp. AP-Jannik-300A-C4]|uniref:MarR family winged helix-turn-helix transcriptional regulator n=1 Tax=Polynucleobacter sp. AP-Jannik-300A-C4 TaxID=2576928 RepID=UPI001BFCE793|nr:MarR family transcriptional regulator [Polynucleobacter sp. AP-Jannik-300A-C4]QWE22621.1 MarR family transcriptional regulator [Polynucleobacter sp. AP-Jannik-300A-C4]
MFEQCLYFNTTSLARKLEREWTIAFKPFGLTPSQAFMLRVILEKPQSYQNALAKEMNITKPTASRGLDGLEKLGLIERRPSPDDAREIEVHPTRKAKAMKDGLNAASGEVTKKFKKLLGSDEFLDVVGKLRGISEIL